MPIKTHGRFRWGLTGLAVGLIMIGLAACQTVPISGRSQLLLVSEADEVQMGIRSYQEILRQSKVSTDRPTQKLVRGESEADRLGLVYMAKADYNPRAARDLWTRMAGVSKGQGRPSEFLSTHPSEATRIRQITEWLPEALQYHKPHL